MVLKKFDDEQATDYDVNRMYNECLSIAGLNLIRMLIDRDIDFSVGEFDWWGDAYIDSNGRENSVSSATAVQITGTTTYIPGFTDDAGGDSTADPDSFTNLANAFDGSSSTYALKTGVGSGVTITLGKTFSSKKVDIANIKVYVNNDGSAVTTTKLQTYNGSSWSDHTTLTTGAGSHGDYTGKILVNDTIEGIRVTFTSADGSWDPRVCILEYGDMEDSTITHTIPSGSFSSTINTAIGVPLINNWETGADIQYKLTGTGGSEDTGWLDAGITPEISTFTAFTAEPDTMIVKLIPKTTSPTSGYPSIKGFVVRAT